MRCCYPEDVKEFTKGLFLGTVLPVVGAFVLAIFPDNWFGPNPPDAFIAWELSAIIFSALYFIYLTGSKKRFLDRLNDTDTDRALRTAQTLINVLHIAFAVLVILFVTRLWFFGLWSSLFGLGINDVIKSLTWRAIAAAVPLFTFVYVDFKLKRNGKEPYNDNYNNIIYIIDYPSISAYLVLTTFCGVMIFVEISSDVLAFFSGVVAFHIIVANALFAFIDSGLMKRVIKV